MARRPTVDERLVVQIWERQAYDPEALRSMGLQLVYRGIPSDAGGPDYQDAVLARCDGSLLRGDIEFHVLSSDWRLHGHGNDPRYNGVVLHVVWERDDPSTVCADGSHVPVLSLSRHAHLRESPPAPIGEPQLWPHPCVRTLKQLTTSELTARITDLGHQRFEERAALLAAEMETVAPDQVLYRSLLEALGYASNREVFSLLAETVPLAWLMSVPADERLVTLLAASRLGPSASYPPPAHLAPGQWRLARLRPGNHPAVRLAGAVELLNRLHPDPVPRLLTAVAEAGRASSLRALLVVRETGTGLIGVGRADEIAASVVLPFVAAIEPQLPGLKRLYSTYPTPPATRWTRMMTAMLSKAGHNVKVNSAPRHQGLHLLYTRYCRQEAPANCPICRGSGTRDFDR